MSGANWRARPVVEFDATADKCLFFDVGTGERMCGHSAGHPACLISRRSAGDDEAFAETQTLLFGDVIRCSHCGAAGPCMHMSPEKQP